MVFRKKHRLRMAAVAAGASLALLLSGCQAAVNLDSSDTAGAAAAPVKGGTLAVAQSSDVQPVNLLSARLSNMAWAANVFEGLTTYDDTGQPQPRLATKWSLSDDSLTMQMEIRDDVTFHTGRAMTADDIKFSIEYLRDSDSQVAFIAKRIDSIEVLDPAHLTFTFSRPISNIFDLFEYAYILDRDTVEEGLADGSKVVGTGPFTFSEWAPGSSLMLERYDDYWGGPVYLDGIDIAVITDSTAMLNAIRGGRSHVALGMSPLDVESLSSDPSFDLIDSTGSVYPLGINTTEEPFDTKEARQAVQIAIDRERIAKQVFGDTGTPTNLFWNEGGLGYPAELENAYPYDPDKARDQLTTAGAAGASVEINVIAIPAAKNIAEIVRNNLEAVGLVPTINVVETQVFGQRQASGELGQLFMPLHGLNGRIGPETLMHTLPALREGNPSNFSSERYAELRRALEDAENEQDYVTRLHDLSELIVDEAFTAAIVRVKSKFVESKKINELVWTSRSYLDAKSTFIAE